MLHIQSKTNPFVLHNQSRTNPIVLRNQFQTDPHVYLNVGHFCVAQSTLVVLDAGVILAIVPQQLRQAEKFCAAI